ncbi:uncharacterized protein LACBIDRAFT_331732 [Laccaria bicolor S238N-H82]|uniref:Predicted protein n=1 Tax=Laccaria bicolor (strain S238N-H82 / ATCC MYA-4686) TaxID=486041 RepID=B0DQD6_LACBS|nr:uncharacterized protein LACBIDRAFT_331732 [Laccaria bicolor S238N-H82]EDR03278.1 predicted protein [Laccaria bicolor S238N-H82]|eukprot:XP_001886074.1 predicted protein [Laccaria bicolor S238N-H82]
MPSASRVVSSWVGGLSLLGMDVVEDKRRGIVDDGQMMRRRLPMTVLGKRSNSSLLEFRWTSVGFVHWNSIGTCSSFPVDWVLVCFRRSPLGVRSEKQWQRKDLAWAELSGYTWKTSKVSLLTPVVSKRSKNMTGTVNSTKNILMKNLRKSSLLFLWKDWLRLIVGHFDATERLVIYVTSEQFQQDSISIKILVAPPTDSALLPWRQLFKNNFLPKFGAINALSTITNKEILEFLNNGISMAVQARNLIHHAELALGWLDKPDLQYETTWQALQYLATNATNTTVQDHATTIIEKLQEWNGLHNSLCKVNERLLGGDERHIEMTSEIAHGIRGLCGELGELDASDRFFLNLENPSFNGTLHFEVCLASLLPAFTRCIPPDDNNYKEMKILSNLQVAYPLSHLFPSFDPHFVPSHMQDYGQVIGVSKHCCPACTTFLRTLMIGSKDDFMVQGNFGTVTACSLPPWTPSHIVDLMNQKLGLMLRQDLVTFMKLDNTNTCSIHRLRSNFCPPY